jgi:hypothetical protein
MKSPSQPQTAWGGVRSDAGRWVLAICAGLAWLSAGMAVLLVENRVKAEM